MASLLSARTTNGSGTALDRAWPGSSIASIYAYGTFGGATVQIEVSPDGTNWFTASGVSFTAQGVLNLEVASKQVRATVSGATGTTSISAELL